MSDAHIASLIQKIESVWFDMNTDYPSACQVESTTDGVMHFTYYEEDEEGGAFVTSTSRDGDLADVLSEAESYGVMHFEIRGLTDREIFELFTAPAYRAALFELASNGEFGDEVFQINGVRFAVDAEGYLYASLLPDDSGE